MTIISKFKDTERFFQSLTPEGYTLKKSSEHYWYESENDSRTFKISIAMSNHLPSWILVKGVTAYFGFKEVEAIYNRIRKDHPYSDVKYGDKTYTIGTGNLNTISEREALRLLKIETLEDLEGIKTYLENGINQGKLFFETHSDISVSYNIGEQLIEDIGTDFSRKNIALMSGYYVNGSTIPAKRAIMKFLTKADDYETFIDSYITLTSTATYPKAGLDHAYYTALKAYLSKYKK